jgi:invasion protein IalB
MNGRPCVGIKQVIVCGLLLAGAALLAAPPRAFAQLFSTPTPKAPARPVAPTAPSVPKAQGAPTTPAAAATGGEAKPVANPPSSQAPAPSPQANGGWIARCVSESRQSPIECSMEQTVPLASNGQVFASVLVRVPADTRAPTMAILVPSGLYLPAGINLQVDEGKPQAVPLQTCDQKGCYAGMPVGAELLSALKSGKRLTMTFQDMAKNSRAVPVALDNFAEAYQKIQ